MSDICKIHLRNLNSDIIEYTIVSSEDFDKVNKQNSSYL